MIKTCPDKKDTINYNQMSTTLSEAKKVETKEKMLIEIPLVIDHGVFMRVATKKLFSVIIIN